MTPRVVEHAGAMVVGIDVTTSSAAEADSATGAIGPLWERFHADGTLSMIPAKLSPVFALGVYTDYESDHTGRYRLLAGAAVEEGTPFPEGLAQARIPAGSYLVFAAEGEMPHVVVETWTGIWNYFSECADHVRSYTADFEVYLGPNEIEIYVAVK